MTRHTIAATVILTASFVSASVSALTDTPSASPSPTPTCDVVTPASLVFTHIDVDPPQPVVGDTIHIDFGVCLENGPGGVFFYGLEESAPLLEGETERAGNGQYGPVCDEGRFEMLATGSGIASVTIRVSYETAAGCVGSVAYFFLFECSDPIAIEIGVGTPHPTRTPTIAATSAQSRTPTQSRTPSPSITATSTRAATPTPPLPGACDGDCNGDLHVTVDEIVFLVFVALGSLPAEGCPHADVDGDGKITVDEILRFVAAALDGCGIFGLQCDGLAGGICPTGEVCDKRNPLCAVIFDHAGTCVAVPEACPAVFFPVCGCDNRTYSNECERVRAGVEWQHDGECRVGIEGTYVGIEGT